MANKITDAFISLVIVLDDKSENIAERLSKTAILLKKNYSNYEIVAVDNGIQLEEFKAVEHVLKEKSCIRVLRLSKVVDIDTAIFAGIEASIGDYTCVLYGGDPVEKIVDVIKGLRSGDGDMIFGVADNLKRKNLLEDMGARLFYAYNRRFLKIDIPHGATYFMGLNRNAVNALTRSGRYSKHLRYLAKQIGFKSSNFHYMLPANKEKYTTKTEPLILRAINLVSSHSSHPLRVLTYSGVFAGFLNFIYVGYVVLVNFIDNEVEAGWTTLSLQSSIMFFFVFMILVALSEYIGQILLESRQESPYHIKQELSSTVSIADETRRNVTK